MRVPPVTDSFTRGVHAGLRSWIIRGLVPPGAPLRERDLVEELGVPRSSIRDALSLLEEDGFIIRSGTVGAVVRTITVPDVNELYRARLAVEEQAARQAALRAGNGAPTDALHQALAEVDAALDSGDAVRVVEDNAAVLDEIVALAGDVLLAQLMAPIRARDRWVNHHVGDCDPTGAARDLHHLCEAICLGRADDAAALARANVEHRRQCVLAILADGVGSDAGVGSAGGVGSARGGG